MNVLMLAQVLPYPPDSGPKVKTYNVIKYLVQEHRVTLASFVRGDQAEHTRHLKRYCQAVHTVPMERGAIRDAWYMSLSLLTRQPFMMLRDDRKAMRDLVDRLSAEQRFDVVHADQLNMAQYAKRLPGAFKLLDTHNALWLLYKRLWETMSPGPRKWLLGRDWRMLKSYEGRQVREFDAVLALSQEDKAALQQAAGLECEITVVPIAIDTDEVKAVPPPASNPHILHIGTMYWPPNIDGVLWFLREIWPLIRQHRPDAVFDVVGSRPPSEIIAYGQNDSGVNVTGYVADTAPYLAQAGIFVVPLRAGGGMRVKILNTLAQGLPIVSTTLGAEGIAVTPGHDILLADEPADFAAAVLRLLDHPPLATRLRHNGRQLAERTYDYRRACQPLSDLYRRAPVNTPF
jgi:glycosyltransferase involved in cell wall biosynthesis